jgi:hypothetical protein
MPNFESLKKTLQHRKAQYHEAVQLKQVELAEQHDVVIRQLQHDIQAVLTDGAEPCPHCKKLPVGLEKQRDLFEVGCPDHRLRSRGPTPAIAVERWNDMEYVTR